ASAKLYKRANTIHKVFGLYTPRERDAKVTLGYIPPEQVDIIRESSVYVFDEISMMGEDVLMCGNERTCSVTGVKLPFGNKKVIWAGDNLQLQAILSKSLFQSLTIGTPAGLLFRKFKRFLLTTNERSGSDPVLSPLITRIWNPLVYPQPFESSLFATSCNNCNTENPCTHFQHFSKHIPQDWQNAKIISSTRRAVNAFNIIGLKRFAISKGLPILRFKAPLASNDVNHLPGYNALDPSKFPDAYGHFVPGASAILTSNINVPFGLTNGTDITLHHLQLSHSDQTKVTNLIRNANPGEIIDISTPDYIYFLLDVNLSRRQMTKYFPFLSATDSQLIIPMEWGDTIKRQTIVLANDEMGKITTRIKKPNFSLGYASTFHCIQGATLNKVIIDLTNYPNFPQGLSVHSVYVAISRAKFMDDILIIGLSPLFHSFQKSLTKILNLHHSEMYIKYTKSFTKDGYYKRTTPTNYLIDFDDKDSDIQ
ncbi:hypothetical protein HDU76_007760, partial [Blyttiomyces sp. JEL0837]